jgi:hypothetical protein
MANRVAHTGRDLVYVADTNAHRIAVVPLEGGELGELEVDF